MQIQRRWFLAGSLGATGAGLLGGCTDPDDDSAGTPTSGSASDGSSTDDVLAAPGSAGLIDEDAYQERIDQYLAAATTTLDPSSATSIAAHLTRSQRDPSFTWDPTAVTTESLAQVWKKIDTWEDTRDFQLLYLNLVLGLADGSTATTTISPDLIDAIEQRMVDNRYRWNDPLPADRLDNQWFWSENHLIIGLVNEYLAGMRIPERTFSITGLTGAEHAARSKQPLLDWVRERARFGFFEWHSNVYMPFNVAPLATLAELAEDPDLILAAGMGLDLCVLDMAGSCHAGAYAAARGRTYGNNKLALRDGTFDTFKLLFDDTELPFSGSAGTGATQLAASRRYRPPQVLVDIATAKEPGVVREAHGIFVDGSAPIVESPEAPFGYDFDDPENLSFWWSQGMLGCWQMAEANLAAAAEFRLFETEALSDVALIANLNGGDPERLRQFVQANHAVINFGHLREANNYGWRNETVSLATVVDHRFGEMRDQIQAWQATVAPGASVFTNHPRNDLPKATNWDDEGKPGYWTGEASIPRSAQHERTAIHIYQPAWDETTSGLLWAVFAYQDFTHAYVPQDRFDEVVRDGNWTFARKGTGYIALWSWREPTWRVYDPAVNPTSGQVKPFDLVAPGGPDNVWIVEVGDESIADSFEDFTAAITAAAPLVQRDDSGFAIEWTSPTSGEVTFGSTSPFTVDGVEQTLGNFPRHESKWGTVERHATKFSLEGGGASLALDFDTPSRNARLD